MAEKKNEFARYATPRCKVEVGTDLTRWPRVVLTFEDKSGNQFDVDSRSGQMEVTPTYIAFVLSQEQTGSLEEGNIKLMVNAVGAAGERTYSKIFTGKVTHNLKDEVLYV